MKKWWLILPILILIVIVVNAKCGDNFCDVKEDENCETCPDDCLCTKDKHDEPIECCNDFTCQECEERYCESRQCSTMAGFMTIFKEIECFDNGSMHTEVTFQELDSMELTPGEDLKVYMKQQKEDTTFTEIKGTWFNPSREGDYRYTRISDTSTFTSDPDLFNLPGKYYVRVKYKVGKRGGNIFEDTEVSCPGMPTEPIPIVEKEEPEIEEVEPPREEPEEEEEEITEEEPEKFTEEPKESNLIWYIITGILILIVIIFFIKYEIKIMKKEE